MIAAAVTPAQDGVVIAVHVVPGAKGDRFPAGYESWRKEVQARVAAPPEGGEANRQLVGLIAAFFETSTAKVAVVSGATSRSKRIEVRGVTVADCVRRLEAAVPQTP